LRVGDWLEIKRLFLETGNDNGMHLVDREP